MTPVLLRQTANPSGETMKIHEVRVLSSRVYAQRFAGSCFPSCASFCVEQKRNRSGKIRLASAICRPRSESLRSAISLATRFQLQSVGAFAHMDFVAPVSARYGDCLRGHYGHHACHQRSRAQNTLSEETRVKRLPLVKIEQQVFAVSLVEIGDRIRDVARLFRLQGYAASSQWTAELTRSRGPGPGYLNYLWLDGHVGGPGP